MADLKAAADKRRLTGLCASFFVLFFAFNAAQNQVAPALGSIGSASLGILYACFALSCLAVPSFLRWFVRVAKKCNARSGQGTPLLQWNRNNTLWAECRGLAVGAAMYCPYFFACSMGPTPKAQYFQLASSALLGIGAGILWVSQGSVLAGSCPHEQRGRWSGIFWGSFMAGGAAGNFFGAAAIADNMQVSQVFTSLGVVALLSIALALCTVRPRPRRHDAEMALIANMHTDEVLEARSAEATSVYGDLLNLCSALRCAPIACLVPSLLFIGCENSFWGGAFTDVTSQVGGPELVATTSGTLALADICSSLICGALLDRNIVDARLVLCASFISFLGGSGITLYVSRIETGANSAVIMLYMAGTLMGAGDGIANTTVLTRLQIFSERHSLLSRRTAFQLFQCVNVSMTSLTFALLTFRPATSSMSVWYLLGSVILISICALLGPRSAYVDERSSGESSGHTSDTFE